MCTGDLGNFGRQLRDALTRRRDTILYIGTQGRSGFFG